MTIASHKEVSALTVEEIAELRGLINDRRAGRIAWKWFCILGAVVTALATIGAEWWPIIRGPGK